MLSRGCLWSAGELRDVDHQYYLHMERTDGTRIELPLVLLVNPNKFLAILNKKTNVKTEIVRSRGQESDFAFADV